MSKLTNLTHLDIRGNHFNTQPEELEQWIVGLINKVNMQVANIPQNDDQNIWVYDPKNKLAEKWISFLTKMNPNFIFSTDSTEFFE